MDVVVDGSAVLVVMGADEAVEVIRGVLLFVVIGLLMIGSGVIIPPDLDVVVTAGASVVVDVVALDAVVVIGVEAVVVRDWSTEEGAPGETGATTGLSLTSMVVPGLFPPPIGAGVEVCSGCLVLVTVMVTLGWLVTVGASTALLVEVPPIGEAIGFVMVVVEMMKVEVVVCL